MYKLFFKMGVMLVIMLGGMSYMFMVKTGRSPVEMFSPKALMNMKPSVISADRPETLLNSESKSGSFKSKGDKTKIYKWTDEYGTTHYTNRAPIEDVDAETISIDPNMNSVAGLKQKEEPQIEVAASKPSSDLSANPYSPQGAKDMMDKAKNIQNLLDNHAAKQKEALDQLR